MPDDILAQNELKELLHYDHNTGDLTWRTSGHGRKANGVAGCLSDGYIRIKIKGKSYFAHRLAWVITYGNLPEDQIDHINHVRDDNRICNLREATNQENHKNRTINRNNTSGVCGVYWDKDSDKWLVSIRINGKLTHLGRFADKFEAICSRKSAEIRYGYHENHGS